MRSTCIGNYPLSKHTTATQLLNVGCSVTSIQKFLGHKKLNTIIVYAHAHDQIVEADYFTAMNRIEQRLELIDQLVSITMPVSASERRQLLILADQLFSPELTCETRLEIASQMRIFLTGQEDWIPPPVFIDIENA